MVYLFDRLMSWYWNERHYPVETCTSRDDVWIPSGDIYGLKLDGRFIHGDVYGEFRQSATTRFIIVLDLEANEA